MCGVISHLARPEFAGRFPQHVTVRMLPRVWNMRSRRCFGVIKRAMWSASERFGFRVVHYAVMGNHIHLLVEADGKRSLSRGMQGLNIRVAKALNRVMGRHGQVLSDHYHAEILLTPTQTKRARQYLLNNARKHYGEAGTDEFTSHAPLHAPSTWFLLRCNV